MPQFEVTLSYKAIISITVNGENAKDAEEKAKEQFKNQRGKIAERKNTVIQDDAYSVQGSLNMDETWNSM